MGRKAKTNVRGPGASGKKRGSKAVPFTALTDKKEKATQAKRERAPAMQAGLTRLVKMVTSSDSASRRFAAQLLKVRRQALSIDDVAASILARYVIIECAVEADEMTLTDAVKELGRCSRELRDLAADYREQGRAVPNEITWRLDLSAAAPAGEAPEGAPGRVTDPVVGDLIEVEE